MQCVKEAISSLAFFQSPEKQQMAAGGRLCSPRQVRNGNCIVDSDHLFAVNSDILAEKLLPGLAQSDDAIGTRYSETETVAEPPRRIIKHFSYFGSVQVNDCTRAQRARETHDRQLPQRAAVLAHVGVHHYRPSDENLPTDDHQRLEKMQRRPDDAARSSGIYDSITWAGGQPTPGFDQILHASVGAARIAKTPCNDDQNPDVHGARSESVMLAS